MRRRVDMFRKALAIAGLSLWFAGCSGGYAGQTSVLYQAVAAGDTQTAIAEADRLVAVSQQENADDLLTSSYPLLLLERASILQALGHNEEAVADFGEADQMLEVLDLTPEGAAAVRRYLFSDDAVLYRPPMYEKLMINISALASYLAMGNTSAAMVEARRMTVLISYYSSGELADHPMLGAAQYVAGLAMEYGGDPMPALRHYISAYDYGSSPGLATAIVRLAEGSIFAGRQEVLDARAELGLTEGSPPPATPDQEVLVIVLSGLPPRREAQHLPIGLVVGWITNPALYGGIGYNPVVVDRVIAEQALTWVNFPALVVDPQAYQHFTVEVGGRSLTAQTIADVESFALAQWELDRPTVAASAVTRAITRILAREATQAITGNDTGGFIASLAVQGVMQAMDTPDTRSWRTMPATVAIARVPVPPGKHLITVTATGQGGTVSVPFSVNVAEGGRAVVLGRFF